MHNELHERSPAAARWAGSTGLLTVSNGASARGWKGIVGMAFAVSAVLLLAGCGDSTSPSSTPSATPAPSGTPSPSPALLDLKPLLRGLLDRSGTPPSGFAGSLAGFVVNVHWSDLQPTSGAAIAPGNAIDKAITEVRALNATEHLHLGLKIRIFAGVWAPEWVKSLGGNPVAITNPQNGQPGTIGRFWTDAFGSAYDQLQTLLAAKYDQVPEVREVTISRCTTFYDEPFIRDTTDPATVSALLGAGYTVAADEICQQQEIQASTVWHHTHSDLSFNPYQVIIAVGSTRTDETFTASMMVLPPGAGNRVRAREQLAAHAAAARIRGDVHGDADARPADRLSDRIRATHRQSPGDPHVRGDARRQLRRAPRWLPEPRDADVILDHQCGPGADADLRDAGALTPCEEAPIRSRLAQKTDPMGDWDSCVVPTMCAILVHGGGREGRADDSQPSDDAPNPYLYVVGRRGIA